MPVYKFNENLQSFSKKINEELFLDELESLEIDDNWLPFYRLYTDDRIGTSLRLFPSVVFTQMTELEEPIVDILKKTSALSYLETEHPGQGEPPISIRSHKNRGEFLSKREMTITIDLTHDAFQGQLISGEDNFDLWYLNAPRINSFLRDVFSLFTSYEGNLIDFIGDERFYSYKGILLETELLYYEDTNKEYLECQKIVDETKEPQKTIDPSPIIFSPLSKETVFSTDSAAEKFKDYPEDSGGKRYYDCTHLPLQEYLNKYYQDKTKDNISQWKQFYEKMVEPSFALSRIEFVKHRRSLLLNISLKINHENIKSMYERIKAYEVFDEDITKFLALINSHSLFIKDMSGSSIHGMINSRKWLANVNVSMGELSQYQFGPNLLRERLSELPLIHSL